LSIFLNASFSSMICCYLLLASVSTSTIKSCIQAKEEEDTAYIFLKRPITFSTLPGIWRALQCLRRYYDTRSVFPHLANCGKYGMTIMYYVSLSLYRFQNHPGYLANFITFATLNAIYCCKEGRALITRLS
jgi:hypothetical protein